MAITETAGNPVITEGDEPTDHEVWVTATLRRLDANVNAVEHRLGHLDDILHRVDQALQPLRDHPEAVAKGLSLLDPGAGVRKFITGRKGKQV
jgi:hypothetical protein